MSKHTAASMKKALLKLKAIMFDLRILKERYADICDRDLRSELDDGLKAMGSLRDRFVANTDAKIIPLTSPEPPEGA